MMRFIDIHDRLVKASLAVKSAAEHILDRNGDICDDKVHWHHRYNHITFKIYSFIIAISMHPFVRNIVLKNFSDHSMNSAMHILHLCAYFVILCTFFAVYCTCCTLTYIALKCIFCNTFLQCIVEVTLTKGVCTASAEIFHNNCCQIYLMQKCSSDSNI